MIETVLKRLRKPVNINVVISVLVSLYSFIIYKTHFITKIGIIFLILSSFFVITARLIYSTEDKRKILAYRIIMGICYALQLASVLISFPMNFSIMILFFPSVIFFCTLISFAAVILLLIIGMENTYTHKLFLTEREFKLIKPLKAFIRPVNFNLLIMLAVALISGYFLFIGAIPFVFLLIVARIVYSAEKAERLTAYRAIMGLCYFGGAGVLALLGACILWIIDVFVLIFAAYIFLVLLYIMCIVNTYTKKILK